MSRVTVPPVPEPVDSTIASEGPPGAKMVQIDESITVQSRTNQGFARG